MVLWIATLAGQLWFGFELCLHFLDPTISIIFVAAFSIPTGIGLSSLLFYFCSVFLGQNFVHLCIHTAALCIISLFLFRLRFQSHRVRSMVVPPIELIPVVVYFLISVFICWKVYFPAPRSLPFVIESQIAEELSLSSSFYCGVNSGLINPFHIHHPNYAGRYAVSRWVTAFHCSMMRIGFASLKFAFLFPSALLATSFLTTVYCLALRFQLPIILAGLCPFMAVLPSGFGFIRFLTNELRTSRLNDYVSQSGARRIRRFHPVFHVLLSFRSTLLAAPIVTGILYILYWSVKFKHNTNKFMLPAAGFLAGFLLPVVQHQSFIGFLVFFGVFVFGRALANDFSKELRGFALLMGIGFCAHLPKYLDIGFLSTLFCGRGPFDGNFIGNWWNDCGLFVVVLVTLSWFHLTPLEFNLWVPVFATIFLFTVFKLQLEMLYNVFVFFAVVYPVGAIVFVATLYRMILGQKDSETKGVLTAIALLVTLSCSLSASMGVTRQIGNSRLAWGHAEEKLAEWIVANTPKGAVFMSPLAQINAISCLAGRQMYYESPDLMSHVGIDSTVKEQYYHTFTNTNVSAEFTRAVDYVVRANEEVTMPESQWKEVYFTRDFAIYQKIKSMN
jgi:hypothetical protein